ncbi:MAG: hypothetical protein ACXWW7_16415 [Nocardioides sp.]
MAKRKAFLHIGPTHTAGDFLDQALAAHAEALAVHGVRRPAKSGEEMFRAVVEIRRVHKAWGYRRREVEGAWSAICRRAHKGRDTVVFSQPHLAAAAPDEIALLLDRLAGFDIHVVVTAPAPAARPVRPGEELASVLTRWGSALRGPERMHVITPDGDDLTTHVWSEFGRIVGFDAARLPVPGWVAEEMAPTGATEERLALALEELERQRVRNDVLEVRNEELARKRKKLKRRLADVVAG